MTPFHSVQKALPEDNNPPITIRHKLALQDSQTPPKHAVLHLVNDTVAFRRQVLRLVIDEADAQTAVDNLGARGFHDFVRFNSAATAPIAGGGPSRLTAARVGGSPVRSFAPSGAIRTSPTPAGEVRREMMAASSLSEQDARLILARRTAEAIEGGTLARLTPARRQGLERLATRLGLRAFDTSLVIAIAQDAARSGEAVHSNAVQGRLGLVGPPTPATAREPRAHWGWALLAASLIGAAIAAALADWILGAR